MANEPGWQRDLGSPGEKLSCLLGSPRLSDVELVFPGKHGTIKAHRLVLAMSSPVLEEMLFGERAAGRELHLAEEDAEAFAWMLGYLYCNSRDLPSSDLAVQVSRLANKYQINDLVRLSSKYLSEHLNEETLPEIYNAAINLNNSDILQECSKFVKEQTAAVLSPPILHKLSHSALAHLLQQTLYVSSEVKVFRAVVSWGQNQIEKRGALATKGNLRKETENLLPHLRFLAMTAHDFVSYVMSSGILTPDESMAILLAIQKEVVSHALPSICSSNRERRQRFDRSLLKSLTLPALPKEGVLRSSTSEGCLLLSRLRANKTLHLSRFYFKGVEISSMTATLRDPAQQVVRVHKSLGASGEFEEVLTLYPGMTCSISASVKGNKRGFASRFSCEQDGVVFEGESLCDVPPTLYYWHFHE